ncbi:MAG: 4-hydroxy-3-methylbut-2-enyl diphosphate reductase [Planctomycetota bacterium]
MKVFLSRPRGFCAGVERAIEIVRRALDKFGPPVYVRHEIVHNRVVVGDLEAAGAVFVDDLAEVPAGARVIFSAHGVAPSVFDEATERGLRYIDATCPLVTKVHVEARSFAKRGDTILLIGHRDHVEVKGVVGEAPEKTCVVASPEEAEVVEIPDTARVAVLTQTTLSVDEAEKTMAVLRRRFPDLVTPRKEDICYATTNRQTAVKSLQGRVDAWLVIGDRTSSNSNRLRELGAADGKRAHLILGPDEIDTEWLQGVGSIGITSGASTPEVSVQQVVDRLRGLGATEVIEVDGVLEDIEFSLPEEVR